MKKSVFTIALAAASVAATAQTPAFPGAEGHGRYVTGGRGGEVRHVTNLNSSGEGSFAAAVQGSDAKIVVFDVAGVIALDKETTIGSNTTIAGQTAPYPGITLRYYTLRPGDNNIIRFIRLRRGQEKDVNDGADAIWQRQKQNGIILDHCSFSWAIDEVASFYDNNNFTMQWCTIAEPLTNAGHGKGAHGYGGIWGGKGASFHHNLLAHMSNRVPRFCGSRYNWSGYTKSKDYDTYKWPTTVMAENVDLRNCVMYNWSGNGCYGGTGGGQINIVNNYYKGGPVTGNSKATRVTQISVATKSNASGAKEFYGMTSRYYIDGNTVETNKGKVTENQDWNGVEYDGGTFIIDGYRCTLDTNNYYQGVTHYDNTKGQTCVRIKLEEPTITGEVTTHSAANAYTNVLKYAGASLYRDEVDARYAEEVANGTATYKGSVTDSEGLIDVVADVKGYTEDNFPTGSRAANFDTDGDGIPDEWETANGLNPNDASDGALYTLDSQKKWYTNLEVYLSSLVESIMRGGNANAETSVEEYYPSYTAAISAPTMTSEVSKIEYFTTNGVQLSAPQKGISIRKMTLANGKTIVDKVIKK